MTAQRGDVLVLFGITGDLARKMILPALYRLSERGELTVPVIGVALTDWDDDRLRAHVADCVHAAFGRVDGGVDEAVLANLQKATHLVAGDYADNATFTRLTEVISTSASDTAFVVHYLAVPPGLFGTVADGLAAVGLQSRSRLVVEKPFGRDLDSARALDALLRRDYAEGQVFRVDHYLGKEPVEDLIVLRFANTLLESIWNRHWIERFEITMAEDFDVADRGSFYDGVGTIRDVVQNHLLQVIAYLLMDAPLSDGADDQRDAKYRVLRAIRAVDPAESVRGQYDGYLGTPGVAAGSTTETFVALTLHVDGWRWAGVPVHVRAGKALPETLLDVVAVLRPPPFALFPERGGRRPRTASGCDCNPMLGPRSPCSPSSPARMTSRSRCLSPSSSARSSARPTPRTSGSSPTPSRATRRISPAWTPSSRRGASSPPSSMRRRHPRRTHLAHGALVRRRPSPARTVGRRSRRHVERIPRRSPKVVR